MKPGVKWGKYIAARAKVRAYYPGAYLFRNSVRDGWTISSADGMTALSGICRTEWAAWIAAARRIEREAVQS